MAKGKNLPEVSQHEVNIIDNLRARNLILRKAVHRAALEASGGLQAEMKNALDRELELSR